mmetsp:Transcript_23512/g.36256  ORF Transcript_23512/g.36256 Transcript_23512/m.36256 type:complete len:808 (-) Transcript_23512:94-2517(-)
MSQRNNASTIFVRNLPPDAARSELEEVFSEIGPVKKASVIRENKSDVTIQSGGRKGLGFGFVRFTSPEDAKAAAGWKGGFSLVRGDEKYKLLVELAANRKDGGDVAAKNNEHKSSKTEKSADKSEPSDEAHLMAKRKRTSRVILRNLAFTATKTHIKNVCSKFGEVVDINLPTVNNNGKLCHRGFAFVTFADMNSAHLAVNASSDRKSGNGGVVIKNRAVAIDFSVPKSQHQQQQKMEGDARTEKKSHSLTTQNNNDEKMDQEDDDSSSSEDSGGDSDTSSDQDNSMSADFNATSLTKSKQEKVDDVKKNCTIFVRNIPFDADRYSMFNLFRKYGRIEGVYLVTDKATGVIKGTAFIKYANAAAAKRALDAGKAQEDTPFVTVKEISSMTSGIQHNDEGIFYSGRRLLIDLAVDRNTAETLRVERDEDGKAVKKVGKDRRNLYLKMEGYIGNNDSSDSWNNIPQMDQEKRTRASNEKSTKLRSPLFFINPHRLSIRNLSKSIDEVSLKKLVVGAIKIGLERGLVTSDDITAQLRAQGLPIRQCIGESAQIPAFDEKDIKQFVPSIFIGREVITSSVKRTELGQSKGFAFVEFTHHAHALACLRELNNNPRYSEEYAVFGKKAVEAKKSKKRGNLAAGFISEDGKVMVPRLILDFTVENKAKAKQQQTRREQQLQNHLKQKNISKERGKSEFSGKEKKGRGALQREKKRKLKELGKVENTKADDSTERREKKNREQSKEKKPQVEGKPEKKLKKLKPHKKLRVDKEEADFDNMVRSYKAVFAFGKGGNEVSESTNGNRDVNVSKRWFD